MDFMVSLPRVSEKTQNLANEAFNILGIIPQNPIDVVDHFLNAVDKLGKLGAPHLSSLNVVIAAADSQIEVKSEEYVAHRQQAYKAIAQHCNV